MKFLQKLTLLLPLVTILFGCGQASLFSISEQQINQYLQNQLAEKVPLKDTVGIAGLAQLKYELRDLQTQIGQNDENRIAVAGVIEADLKVRGKHYATELTLNLDAEPYYDPDKGALFVKNLRLVEWQSSNEKYQKELQFFLPLVLDYVGSALNQNPVYTLDEKKAKEALVKQWGKAIKVEKGKIILETAIF